MPLCPHHCCHLSQVCPPSPPHRVPPELSPVGLCPRLRRPLWPFPGAPTRRGLATARQGLRPRSWVRSGGREWAAPAPSSACLLLSHRGCADGRHHRGGRRSWRGLPRPSGNHCGLLLCPLPEKYGRETRELREGGREKGQLRLPRSKSRSTASRGPTNAVSCWGRDGPRASFHMQRFARHLLQSGRSTAAELDGSELHAAGPSASTSD